MTPSTEYLLDSLLLLLLPGFLALKIWERFYPRIPSQKQETFDKVATYFVLTIISYLISFFISFPVIEKVVGEPLSNFYHLALIASCTAILFGLVISSLALWFNSAERFDSLRNWGDSFLPQNTPIWYKAFQSERRKQESVKKDRVFVKVGVFMKNGVVYGGELDSYPIEDNIEDTKDFLIKGVTLLRTDGKKIKYNPDFRLLLNQRDVDAILFQYVSSKRIKEKEKLSK